MKTELDTIRTQLTAAAQHEPPSTQPFIEQINTQLRNFAKANAEDRIALRPQINASMKRLEAKRASHGR